MGHHCHARGCKVEVPPEMLMCKRHWSMVPKDIQTAVWNTYRRGQCDDKAPSEAWHQAADAAILHVARTEMATPALAPATLAGKRVILLHSISATDDDILACAQALAEFGPAKITSARRHWERAGAAAGGFRGWPQAVLRMAYGSNRPEFDALVAISPRVGRATAQVVAHALTLRRPVFLLEESTIHWSADETADGPPVLRPVVHVATVDPKDMKTGWELR